MKTALLWGGDPFAVETQLLYHKNKWLTPALTEFLVLTRNYFVM